MGRKRRNNVYRHYMLQEESQTSTCLVCYKTLNTIHGSNLMNHLKFMHKAEYQQVLALNSSNVLPIIASPRDSPNSNDDDSNHSDSGLEVDVEKFFTMEQLASRARCDICQKNVDVSGDNLINHLKREHPKILKPSNDDSDGREQDELYQEIVYLYDSDSKSMNNVRPAKLASSTPMSLHKQKAKQNSRPFKRPSINLENRKRRRTLDSVTGPPVEQFSEELENFGKYVTSLLRTVPEDLCTQLQMEIINLIMTAKIKNNMSKSEASTSFVQKLDGADVSTGTYDPSIVVSVNTSKLDKTDASLSSSESNTGEMKTLH